MKITGMGDFFRFLYFAVWFTMIGSLGLFAGIAYLVFLLVKQHVH